MQKLKEVAALFLKLGTIAFDGILRRTLCRKPEEYS
jgi:hypothetical protein